MGPCLRHPIPRLALGTVAAIVLVSGLIGLIFLRDMTPSVEAAVPPPAWGTVVAYVDNIEVYANTGNPLP